MARLPFVGVLGGMWCVFLSVGVLVPLIPQYVTGPLGMTRDNVGVTILLYAVAGVLSRPVAGSYLRNGSPWRMMLVSAVAGAVALAATPLVVDPFWMWWWRLVDGFAIGCFYTAAATCTVQAADPDRRGSALAYFSVPLFLGVALGPMLGDALIPRAGQGWTWVASGMLLALAVPFSVLGAVSSRGSGRPRPADVEELVPRLSKADLWRTIAHPAAMVPAAVLVLVVAGWSAYQAFVPLYGPTLGMATTGPLFFVYSVVVLVIRIGGARLFDRLPLVELVLLGTAANTVGLVVVWLWRAVPALFVGAALMGLAIGVGYTTLLRIALHGVPKHEEGAVIGAYSLAYDLGAGLGAAGLGFVGAWFGSYSSIFAGGAVCGAVSLVLATVRLWPVRAQHRTVRPPDGRLSGVPPVR